MVCVIFVFSAVKGEMISSCTAVLNSVAYAIWFCKSALNCLIPFTTETYVDTA